MHRTIVTSIFTLLMVVCLQTLSAAQTSHLRIVNYNVLHGPSGSTESAQFSNIMQAIGQENRNGIARPVDALSLQETNNTSIQNTTNILNNLYGAGTYSYYITPQGKSGLWNGVVYNTTTLNLISSTQVTSSSLTRNVARVHFDPVNNVSNDDFYLYSMHLKAGQSDATRRGNEVNIIRNNADALGSDAQIIFSGDFNMYHSSEAGFLKFRSTGNAKAVDPINRLGVWHDSYSFRDVHTQDPSSMMDDRFDFQLLTEEFFDGQGIDYLANSYRAFGNNGQHNLNGSITTGYGPSDPFYSTALALSQFSDHLPVVADYVIHGIPEPATLVLLTGSTLLVFSRRRRSS